MISTPLKVAIAVAVGIASFTAYTIAFALEPVIVDFVPSAWGDFLNGGGGGRARVDIDYAGTITAIKVRHGCSDGGCGSGMGGTAVYALKVWQGTTLLSTQNLSFPSLSNGGYVTLTLTTPVKVTGRYTLGLSKVSGAGTFIWSASGTSVAGVCGGFSGTSGADTCDSYDPFLTIYGTDCSGTGCEYTHTDIRTPLEGSTTASKSFDVSIRYYANSEDTSVSEFPNLVMMLCNLSQYNIDSFDDYGKCEFWVIDESIDQNAIHEVTGTVLSANTGYYQLVSGLWNGESFATAGDDCKWWDIVCQVIEGATTNPRIVALDSVNVIVASASLELPPVDPRKEVVAQYCGTDDSEWFEILDSTAFGVCQSLVMLFMPTQFTTEVDKLSGELMSKVPFGFFGMTYESIHGISQVSSSSATNLQIDVLGITDMTIVDWEAIKSSEVGGWLDLISPLIIWSMWVWFAIHIWGDITGDSREKTTTQ